MKVNIGYLNCYDSILRPNLIKILVHPKQKILNYLEEIDKYAIKKMFSTAFACIRYRILLVIAFRMKVI